MFDWIKLAVGLLSLVQTLLRWGQSSRDFSAGEEKEILAAAKATMAMTAEGKRIAEKIDAMSEADLGGLLNDLGKPDEPGKG